MFFYILCFFVAVFLAYRKPDIAERSKHIQTKVTVKIDVFENALRDKLLGLHCSRVRCHASLIVRIQGSMKLIVLSVSLLNAEALTSVWTHCQLYEGNLDVSTLPSRKANNPGRSEIASRYLREDQFPTGEKEKQVFLPTISNFSHPVSEKAAACCVFEITSRMDANRKRCEATRPAGLIGRDEL